MHRCKKILLALALVPLAGYSDCEYYRTVTIPTRDTTPPWFATRIFVDGEDSITLTEEVRRFSDPNQNILVISSAMDSGGVRDLSLNSHVSVWCNDGSGVDLAIVPQRDHQDGTPGQQVSNGLYVWFGAFRFADYASFCDDNGGVEEIVYTWASSATDFHGNGTDFFGGELTYRP